MLIAIKKIAPALAAGNSIVVKPSELAPCTLIEFAHLLKEAGLPDGTAHLFYTINIMHSHQLCSIHR